MATGGRPTSSAGPAMVNKRWSESPAPIHAVWGPGRRSLVLSVASDWELEALAAQAWAPFHVYVLNPYTGRTDRERVLPSPEVYRCNLRQPRGGAEGQGRDRVCS